MIPVKTWLVALAAVMLSFAPLAAWAEAPVAAPAIKAEVHPRPLMWVIRDEDSTIYLFGSIHAMRDDVPWMTPAIAERFKASQEMWLEIGDIDDVAHVQQVALKYMIDPKGQMTAGLTPDEVAELDRRLGAYGMNSQMLMRMHKWAVGLILVQKQFEAMGLESGNGIDVTLLRQARAAKMPVHGFETMDEQMQIFATKSDEEDTEALRKMLKEMDETPGMINDLIAGWIDGDETVLLHYLIDKEKEEDPDGYRRFITERNANWAPKIEDILKGKGTVFIAVGTAHLVGPDSVIALLRKDGVKVEAVTTGE